MPFDGQSRSEALIAFELHFAFCWIRRWNDICFARPDASSGRCLYQGLRAAYARAAEMLF